MSYPSDRNTTGLRYVSKRKDVEAVQDKNILGCVDLIGKKLEMDVPGEVAATKKKIIIVKLYPYHAQGTYKAGKENQYEFKIGLSISDLVEKGVLTFERGFAEVV